MINNFYLHQLMKKSDRKNYLGNKHGVFTITFPKKIKNNSRLKFVFKPGNTYIIKGETLENIDLVFPNSNVLIEGIEFIDCSIKAKDGVVNYYCNHKINGITVTEASKISVSDYDNEKFFRLPFISNDLFLCNTHLSNINCNDTMDIIINANQNIELDNCVFNFSSSSNSLINPNQKFKFNCSKLLIKNSTISTIINNKLIKNNDNIDTRDESLFSISLSATGIELENSSIESGHSMNVFGDNVTLSNSLIGSIRNLEINAETLTMDENSDIVAVKPIFWEEYISRYNISASSNEILYSCEKSLRRQYCHTKSFSNKIDELASAKELLLNGGNETQKKNLR